MCILEEQGGILYTADDTSQQSFGTAFGRGALLMELDQEQAAAGPLGEAAAVDSSGRAAD
jgi:hypothetical protein